MTKFWEITATALLAVPGLLIALLVVAVSPQNTALALGIVAVVVLTSAGLHLAAKKVETRLDSARLPWTMWALALVAQAAVVFGLIATTLHFNRVDAGMTDPSFAFTAPIAAVVTLVAAVTFITVGGVVLTRFVHTPVTA